ncbi:baculoviral IAP repeat-containing protein 5.1-like isoform X2 [Brachyhypopomus gauderio]
MAKAGFIHVPTDNSPDVAQCFFCYKELEGWEPQDDPVKEHKLHSSTCHFIQLKKNVEDLTVEEFLRLQKERQKFYLINICTTSLCFRRADAYLQQSTSSKMFATKPLRDLKKLPSHEEVILSKWPWRDERACMCPVWSILHESCSISVLHQLLVAGVPFHL